jgi:DNA-binding HxlR family transcriptional regulator
MGNTPQPGHPVRGSSTGRPLMAALDLLGRRWALRVLWELRDGPLGARELRERCDRMSTSVLYERLRDLAAAGLIHRHSNDRYQLTSIGASLATAIAPLEKWAHTWALDTRTGRIQRTTTHHDQIPPEADAAAPRRPSPSRPNPPLQPTHPSRPPTRHQQPPPIAHQQN